MHTKTSFKVFNAQVPLVPMEPQVIDAPTASKMAVYQDAYRKASALLRQKGKKDTKTFNTQDVDTIQDEHKIANIALTTEVTQLTTEIFLLQSQLSTANDTLSITQQSLDDAHHSMAGYKVVHMQSEVTISTLRNRFDNLLISYNGIAAQNAQTKIEDDKVFIGETLTALYVEQERTKALETKLAASEALLKDAHERTAQYELVLDELKASMANAADDEDDEGVGFSFSASTYELELERDMYQSQEQEALDALEAEKAARLALETALQVSREKEQQAIAISEAHEQARFEADKERLEVSAQLKAALATLAELTAAIIEKDGGDCSLISEFSMECAGDDLPVVKVQHSSTPKQLQSVQHPFLFAENNKQCLTPMRDNAFSGMDYDFDSESGFLGLPAVDLFAHTPVKFVRGQDKENVSVVFRTPRSIHHDGLVFNDPVFFSNPQSTPVMSAVTQGSYYSPSPFEYHEEFDDSIFGVPSPALS
ncbi:hypothetical protein BDY19DRAFT_1017698 [Irpex rosettiformis]|uniref:Uncharacterized protein n=1 Tax=Irpex rosettiformis TaxID=378272 RepID=A0ACB8TW31_9APHY|nr:hypothetical protein BDY19DRAFT_1017698 [Irpex rosettiformis]